MDTQQIDVMVADASHEVDVYKRQVHILLHESFVSDADHGFSSLPQIQ